MSTPRAQRAVDAVGLAGILLFLLDAVPPELLLLPTITAGGDTPCHYPTLVTLYERFLPELRISGWDPGAYLGQPLLLYYFPLPFLAMAALAPLFGLPVAFKLGGVLGVFLLPFLTYLSFALMRLRFPTPLLGATAATLFLFMEANPIWGGTLASTLTGEFAYAYGIALAVLFLGVAYRAYSRGDGPWLPAALLGLTAFAHGYAVLWGGLTATHFLYGSRRPWKTLRWLSAVALLAFAFAGAWLLPLLGDWGWTTPFNDAWISVDTENVAPPYLAPLFALAIGGWLVTLTVGRRRQGADQRLLLLLHAAAVGAALAAAGPALGIIDVRFLPFAQLAAALAGAAALGLALSRLGSAAAGATALGLLVAGIVYADASSRVLRFWVEWNYTGLEAKELWPRYRELTERIRGDVAQPRVAVEYSTVHERAGSIRMYETLPHFSGRSTLEGVYNQASPNTHAIYYLTSELGASSPNPFRFVEFSEFDTDNALRHLRLFNTREVVAVSDKLTGALEARDDVVPLGRVPPYALFRLRDAGPGYVEPLRFAPVRSSPAGWRAKAYRWFTRKPLSPVHLVFSDDARFDPREPDEWLPPPGRPLAAGVRVRETVTEEAIEIETSSVGHPLLVKLSYHPRWRAEGAHGPYLVSPALMLLVPTRERIRLHYAGSPLDGIGLAISLSVLAAAGLRRTPIGRRLVAGLRRPRALPPIVPSFVVQGGHPPSPRRWGPVVPLALLAGLVALRLAPGPQVGAAAEAAQLEALAREALQARRFEDAAEYARHSISRRRGQASEGRARLLRGEALLGAGRYPEAAAELEEAAERARAAVHRRRALALLIGVRLGQGDAAGVRAARERLSREPLAAGTVALGKDQVAEP